MQILMIGNGFDIEHNLPTQYRDFLEFAREFLEIHVSEERNAAIEKLKMQIEKNSLKIFFLIARVYYVKN